MKPHSLSVPSDVLLRLTQYARAGSPDGWPVLAVAPEFVGACSSGALLGALPESYYQVHGDTAVIQVVGLIMPTKIPPSWWSDPPVHTTHAMIRNALEASEGDNRVKRRVMVWNSPGGPAQGLSRLAEEVRASAGRKPLESVTEAGCFSAAYMLAAQTHPITVSPEGMFGSVGSLILVHDYSKMFAAAGVKVHAIGSGPLKGMGEFGTKLTPDQKAKLQEIVNDTAQVFKDAVARGRGITPAQVNEIATGGWWVGQRCVALRLADRIGTLQDVLHGTMPRAAEPDAVEGGG